MLQKRCETYTLFPWVPHYLDLSHVWMKTACVRFPQNYPSFDEMFTKSLVCHKTVSTEKIIAPSEHLSFIRCHLSQTVSLPHLCSPLKKQTQHCICQNWKHAHEKRPMKRKIQVCLSFALRYHQHKKWKQDIYPQSPRTSLTPHTEGGSNTFSDWGHNIHGVGGRNQRSPIYSTPRLFRSTKAAKLKNITYRDLSLHGSISPLFKPSRPKENFSHDPNGISCGWNASEMISQRVTPRCVWLMWLLFSIQPEEQVSAQFFL